MSYAYLFFLKIFFTLILNPVDIFHLYCISGRMNLSLSLKTAASVFESCCHILLPPPNLMTNSFHWSYLLDLLFFWSQIGFFISLLHFANSCWWLFIYYTSMVNMKIFLQNIGPHYSIWYWLYVVDTMYTCVLGCACVYLCLCGRVGKKMVSCFYNCLKKCG